LLSLYAEEILVPIHYGEYWHENRIPG